MSLALKTSKMFIFYDNPFSSHFCPSSLGIQPEIEISGPMIYWKNVPKKGNQESRTQKQRMSQLEVILVQPSPYLITH